METAERSCHRFCTAGEDAGTLTEEGAKLLDVSGNLQPGSLGMSAGR